MVVGVYDLLTLGIGFAGYALGRSRGLAWQASGLVTLVGGGLCATALATPLGPAFAEGVAGRFAAWIVVYVAVATCLYVITLRFKHKLKELEYDELDKRFGGLFGALKGLLVFAVITLVSAGLSQRIAGAVKRSACGQALRALVHEVRPALPEQVHDAFGPWLDPMDGGPGAPTPPAPRWPTDERSPGPGPTGARPTPTEAPQPRPQPTPTQPVAPAQPVTPTPPVAGPPAPPATRPAPAPARPPRPVEPDWSEDPDADVEAPSRPTRSNEAPDPFDTSKDALDPLAPPR